MSDHFKKPTPGREVMLRALPAGFVDDLSTEDQNAILDVVGKRLLLKAYEEDGRAELEFTDQQGVIHAIWLDPKYIVE
jgi:hypothetical protein